MRFKSGFWGFIFGGVTAAIFALLYAPRSGDETRQLLNEKSEAMKENALETIQEARDLALTRVNEAQVRLEELNTETRRLLAQLQVIGKDTLEKQKNILEEGYGKAKEVVNA